MKKHNKNGLNGHGYDMLDGNILIEALQQI